MFWRDDRIMISLFFSFVIIFTYTEYLCYPILFGAVNILNSRNNSQFNREISATHNRQPFYSNYSLGPKTFYIETTPLYQVPKSIKPKNLSTRTQYEFKNEDQNMQPTNQVNDDDLRNFSETLLVVEDNASKYVRTNFQSKTTSRSKNDEAPLPLLNIDKEIYNMPTIKKLLPLYDNYIIRSNVNEDHTYQQKQEETAFLESIIETEVMKKTKQFLIGKGAFRNERDFKNILREIWFDKYTREKKRLGSSGFEHVFLGEIKKNEVSGLHNWLYFEREESKHNANYLGYLKIIDLGMKRSILKFNFDFYGINKPVGSMFIGTSPELEMALYSVCFILRADKICPLKLNGKKFIIRTYTYTYDGKKLIGSAFAEI